MYEKIETKNDSVVESDKYVNLIGILLISPFWILMHIPYIWDFIGSLNLNDGAVIIFNLTLMYLPIIIGMALSYRLYKSKISISIIMTILVFLVLAIYFCWDLHFVERGWDSLGIAFLWLINTVICKVLSCVFYSKIAGKKKGMIFLIIYILVIVSSFLLGFWR